jgi:hypothetical protein
MRHIITDLSPNMNSVIEIHDSRIVGIASSPGLLIVRFGPAYIHRSEGRPGVDIGSGWLQDLELVISDPVLECTFTEWPQELTDGMMVVGDRIYENLIPLPFAAPEPVRFSAISTSGERMVIEGSGAHIRLNGEARHVEAFPGDALPS